MSAALESTVECLLNYHPYAVRVKGSGAEVVWTLPLTVPCSM